MNHNYLRKIEGLECKSFLQLLNLKNNWIQDINNLDHLRAQCTSLRELSLKCNPISAKKSYRASVFSKLSSLLKLDDIAITDKDKDRVKNDFIVLNTQIIMDTMKVQVKSGNETGK